MRLKYTILFKLNTIHQFRRVLPLFASQGFGNKAQPITIIRENKIRFIVARTIYLFGKK